MARKKKVEETIWNRDITHHVVATLAVFGLVVSSFITTVGIAGLGVQAQVAFAQNSTLSQTAAVALANATIVYPSPVASSTPVFCPQLTRTIGRGVIDATSAGDVTQLQEFLTNRYNLVASSTVSGYFGPITQLYLEKFQQEQGIPPAPTAGPLTRAAIARLCGRQASTPPEGAQLVGSSTTPNTPSYINIPPVPVGVPTTTSTVQPVPTPSSVVVPPPPPYPATPIVPPVPVSYTGGAANAANMVEAMSEIGDGYTRLFQSVLSSFGL